jgi:prepilin-type N-terminal cleavage/methylation domain-containing protein
MKRLSSNAFSLAEVIVALVIVSIALLGLLRLQLISIAASEKTNALTEAMLLAQSKIEETGVTGLPPLGTTHGSVRENTVDLNWQRSITQSQLPSLEQGVNRGLHKVTVSVSWTHGLGKKTVEMITYVADRTLP